MTAKTVVAPLERVKIMYQVTNEKFSLNKFLKVLSDIVRKDGAMALWRGHSASLLRVIPYAGIQFMTYDYAKRIFMNKHDSGNSSVQIKEYMLCGGAAGATGTAATYPLDLARSRIAVTPRTQDARPRFYVFRSLLKWHQIGGLTELYKGFIPTVLGVIPYGAISFSTNEAMRRFLLGSTSLTSEEQGKLKTWHKLLSGGIAGIVAQTSTYPFEIMRRRMQTAGHVDSNASIESTYANVQASVKTKKVTSNSPRSILGVFLLLYKTNGWRVFYKGVSLNWIKGPIAISISFTTFDIYKKLLQQLIT